MTTSVSPDLRPVVSDEEDSRDFGYGAGAAEIQALFATRFKEARRLPRHQVASAIAALRDEKTRALHALKVRCQRDRLAARAAERDLERVARRPVVAERPRLRFDRVPT